MCGIVGFVTRGKNSGTAADSLQAMVASLRHRGPDDCGHWHDLHEGVALGHTRLSIVDLSPTGHQPMSSNSGRYVIVFNGEIYNFHQLAEELSAVGHRFRGTSDTEVMLGAFEEWGFERSVAKFNGMFAFAVWDKIDRRLILGRDRMGVKPLYYGWTGDGFIFGSEIKPLEASPGFKGEINRDAVASLMRYSYIPAPHSIYKGIYKLSPGCLMMLGRDDLICKPADFSPNPGGSFRAQPKQYWSAAQVKRDGPKSPFAGTDQEAISTLEELLKDSIKLRMISDVPLGAFLSGGIDSSIVVALMQAQSSIPVKTFTIGFNELTYNEAQHAKQVAEHIGTDHTELYLSEADAIGVIPQLPKLYDEPFSDCSQIPTYLVSKMARQTVTVSLSGDGGDELFGGYERYLWANKIWRSVQRIPSMVRRLAAKSIGILRPGQWDSIFSTMAPVIPRSYRVNLPGHKLYKVSKVLRQPVTGDLYRQVISHWDAPEELVLGSTELRTLPLGTSIDEKYADFLQQMMFLDLVGYMPDDILVKVDRASMGVSLEAREPMIDYRIVELASTFPNSLKIRNGVTKWALRQVLYRYVPPALIDRPKMGFGVPIGNWLRGALRPWAEDLLNPTRLKQDGFFNVSIVRQKWEQHLSGAGNWQYHIWDLLMFQAWLHRST